MVEGFITNQEKINFREIVLAHIKDILKLSEVEFRGGYWQDVGTNPVNHVYVPDSRDCYINAVLSFCDILAPYFDKEMLQCYNQYYSLCLYPGTTKFIKNKLFVDWIKEVANNQNPEEILNDVEKKHITEFKVYSCRILFKELNLLLHRKDYLKEAIFSEGEEEE